MTEEARSEMLSLDLRLEIKRRIVGVIVDDMKLDVNTGWLKTKGVLRGTFSINDGGLPVSVGAGIQAKTRLLLDLKCSPTWTGIMTDG